MMVLFRSRVASRVEAMEGALERATHGDLTVRIEDNLNDEITRIAGGINYLVEQLRSSFRRIAELSESSSRTTGAIVASFKSRQLSMSLQQQ